MKKLIYLFIAFSILLETLVARMAFSEEIFNFNGIVESNFCYSGPYCLTNTDVSRLPIVGTPFSGTLIYDLDALWHQPFPANDFYQSNNGFIKSFTVKIGNLNLYGNGGLASYIDGNITIDTNVSTDNLVQSGFDSNWIQLKLELNTKNFINNQLKLDSNISSTSSIFRYSIYKDIYYGEIPTMAFGGTGIIYINVANANRVPIFTSPDSASFNINEDQELSFNVAAMDPDDDLLTFTVDGLPPGSSLDTATGLFSWKPTISQSGVYNIRLFVTDNGDPSLTSQRDLLVTVSDVPATQRVSNLIENVIGINLQKEIESSYLSNLKKIPVFIEAGNLDAALNEVKVFIKKVENDISKGAINNSIGSILLNTAYGIERSLPGRLNEIISLAENTGIGQILLPYMQKLYENQEIELTNLPSKNIKGQMSTIFFMDQIDNGNDSICIFQGKQYVKLNRTVSLNHLLAGTLIHELTHFRDAIKASNDLKSLNVADTEINAHANQYLYFKQKINKNGIEGTDASEAWETLDTFTKNALIACYKNVYEGGDRDNAINALIMKGYNQIQLLNNLGFVCIGNY